MFRKIIYVFLGFFATVFALNVETGFNDGIMNVTLYEVEGLAQGECGDNGFTECPDRGSTLISCVIKDPVTHETAPGEMDFCMSEGRGCAITPCYNLRISGIMMYIRKLVIIKRMCQKYFIY